MILDDETPDLIIESITPVSENPKPNFPIKLLVTVKNVGLRTASNLNVSIWKHRDSAPVDENGILSSQTVYNLTVGQSVALDFYVTYEEQGTFTFWAMADAKKEVNESNEENNTLSLGIDTKGHTFSTSSSENENTSAQTAVGGCGTSGLSLLLLTAVGFVLVTKWSNP
jgi:subtilase family serine protease